MQNYEITTSMFPVAPPYDMVYKNEVTHQPVGPHSHNAVEFYYTLTDLPDVLLNDKILEVKAGTLLVIPTFCTHQLYHEAGKLYERYIFSINTQWLDTVFCEGAPEFSYLKDTPMPILLYPDKKGKQELKEKFETRQRRILPPRATHCATPSCARRSTASSPSAWPRTTRT